jgi:exodeoxyribonuclease (lambda-induced)
MIFIYGAPQGGREWFQARVGVITASRFADAVSVLKKASGTKKAGDPSGAAEKYACDLAIERISRKHYGDTFETFAMKRGTELEAMARMIYESRTGNFVDEAGIVLTDDRLFGYSTDGFVNDDGLIEIKCPIDSVKVFNILKTGDISDYMHQIQGGLWITGRKWCDFVMHCPDLEAVNKDLYIKRIDRNEDFISKLETDLMAFAAVVSDCETLLKQKAA